MEILLHIYCALLICHVKFVVNYYCCYYYYYYYYYYY